MTFIIKDVQEFFIFNAAIIHLSPPRISNEDLQSLEDFTSLASEPDLDTNKNPTTRTTLTTPTTSTTPTLKVRKKITGVKFWSVRMCWTRGNWPERQKLTPDIRHRQL